MYGNFLVPEVYCYGLGSLRKTPKEGTSHIGPGPTSGQLAFNLQPTGNLLMKLLEEFKNINLRDFLFVNDQNCAKPSYNALLRWKLVQHLNRHLLGWQKGKYKH